jgi:hypothetical protein
MSDPITLPPPDEIAERIRACREELAALRKLQRLARTAQDARDARERRHPVTVQPHPDSEERHG